MKKIIDFWGIKNGAYEIFDDGKIFSFLKNKFLTSNYFDSKDGYRVITLMRNDGGYQPYRLHRLLAMAFIKKEKNKNQINHINGIKTDNRIENLEWCTHQENMQDAYLKGLRKQRFRLFDRKEVLRIRRSKKLGITLAKEFCCDETTIYAVRNRKTYKDIF